jgi:DNA-binding transcriptional LysR family regulator
MACVQTGSFSKAAELLFTTQPSVSKIIKSMEDEMNVSLFERYAKGIILTPEGKRIYSYAKKVMENLEKIETNSITRKTVQLSVSYNPSLWFADIFIDFF